MKSSNRPSPLLNDFTQAKTYRNAIFCTLFFSLLIIGFYFGWNKQPIEMGLSIAAGFLLFILHDFEKIEDLSVGSEGLKLKKLRIETNEKLNEVVVKTREASC